MHQARETPYEDLESWAAYIMIVRIVLSFTFFYNYIAFDQPRCDFLFLLQVLMFFIEVYY
jgi:hypothetical protein